MQTFINKNQYDIGEAIQIVDFYKVLQKVSGVVDVLTLEIKPRSGGIYAETSYDMVRNLSADGRRVLAPDNIIFELKFPNLDIKGSIR